MKKESQMIKIIEDLASYIPAAEKVNPKITGSNVAWQIDHSLKVIKASINMLKNADPSKYQPKFSLVKSVIMFTGKIPRGKAKAPKQVNYKGDISKESLKNQVAELKEIIADLNQIPEKNFFRHPIFGDLDKKRTLKFIKIHSKHHLKIIKDIIK